MNQSRGTHLRQPFGNGGHEKNVTHAAEVARTDVTREESPTNNFEHLCLLVAAFD